MDDDLKECYNKNMQTFDKQRPSVHNKHSYKTFKAWNSR